MKVKIVNKNTGLSKDKLDVIETFIVYCQDTSPLKKDVSINLLSERIGKMTTGSEITGTIKVLSKGRMLRDIIKTLAHEWVHEFARQRNIKLQGYNTMSQEDYANSESALMVTNFEKKHPEFSAILYT
jgi:hypothetical protein